MFQKYWHLFSNHKILKFIRISTIMMFRRKKIMTKIIRKIWQLSSLKWIATKLFKSTCFGNNSLNQWGISGSRRIRLTVKLDWPRMKLSVTNTSNKIEQSVKNSLWCLFKYSHSVHRPVGGVLNLDLFDRVTSEKVRYPSLNNVNKATTT